MAKVFISYRRADSPAMSGRIYDHLVARFRRKHVFKDVDDIPAGVHFGAYIQASLRECAVMLVIIGRHWLDASAQDGRRRLSDPADWVRVEIETAFALGLTVIPLLVEGAAMPAAADLPESLQALAGINSLHVRNDPDFARDMERVIAAVEHAPAAARPSAGFLRRGPQAQPAPQQSTAALRTPSSMGSAQAVAEKREAAAPATVITQERNAASLAQPLSSGTVRVRRIMLGTLAALLVVALLGGALFYASTHLATGAGARNQPTQTPTATATATATHIAFPTLPVAVATPGPGDCATGGLRAYWTMGAYGAVDCSNHRSTRLSASPCTGCQYNGSFQFDTAPLQLPTSYTISVKVSNIAANTQPQFAIVGTGGAELVTISLDGSQYLVDSATPCPSGGHCTGPINTSATHILVFHLDANAVTAKLDGKSLVSYPEATAMELEDITFGVDIFAPGGIDHSTPSPYHADFSDFSITAA